MSVVSEVHVGEPNDSSPFEGLFEERALIHFHNFADLTQQKGTKLRSSKFTCAGHEWYLSLYPRGDRGAKEGMISIFLGTDLTSKIVVKYRIALKEKTGDNFRVKSSSKKVFSKSSGWGDYASRDAILDASNNVLNNGTLTFEVQIRPHENYICHHAMPKSSVADDLYGIYQDEDTADIAFVVEANVFYAHKNILKARVPELAQLAEPYNAENSIPINDVEPDIFETMLKHVYGKDIIGASYWEDHAKQVLDASGKYGFAELKSVAEAWHVKNLHLNFTVDNVVDELLYADGKNCPLLKKAAMDFIVEHGREVIESDSYGKLDESPELRKEVMKASFSINERKPDE